MKVVIRSVDHAPDDLDAQLPIRGRLVRMLEGSDSRGRSYWLTELTRPISWKNDGGARTIRHLLIAARWVGTSIQPGAKIPINITAVLAVAVTLGPGQDHAATDAVFVGATPCGSEVRRFLSIPSRAPCDFIAWNVALSSEGARVKLGALYGVGVPNQPGLEGGGTPRQLAGADEHILMFTDDGGSLLPGDSHFSYTLNRVTRARTRTAGARP